MSLSLVASCVEVQRQNDPDAGPSVGPPDGSAAPDAPTSPACTKAAGYYEVCEGDVLVTCLDGVETKTPCPAAAKCYADQAFGVALCHEPAGSIETCGLVLGCMFRDCSTAADEEEEVRCQLKCRADASAGAAAELGPVNFCVESCLGASAWQIAQCFLIEDDGVVCTQAFSACVGGGTGSDTCGDIRTCMRSCALEQDPNTRRLCENGCLQAGDDWAQVTFVLFQFCAGKACSGAPTEAQRHKCENDTLAESGACKDFATDCKFVNLPTPPGG